VADLPGLIDGAHLNRGLGINFLRHIGRCLCLVFVIDFSPDSSSALPPWEVYSTLRSELSHYDAAAGLLSRPSLIVANKMDLPGADANLKAFTDIIKDGSKIYPISAKFGVNVRDLLIHLRSVYDQSLAGREKDTESKYDPVRFKSINNSSSWRDRNNNPFIPKNEQ
jgi:GTP-binding protein